MSNENVEIVRRAYAAFNRSELEGLAEVVNPDWVMDWSQSIGPQKGVYRGLEGAREWIAATREAFESFEVEPLEFIPAGDRILVRARVKGIGRGSGIEVNAVGATLWELRDGKVIKMTLYQREDDAREAAGFS